MKHTHGQGGLESLENLEGLEGLESDIDVFERNTQAADSDGLARKDGGDSFDNPLRVPVVPGVDTGAASPPTSSAAPISKHTRRTPNPAAATKRAATALGSKGAVAAGKAKRGGTHSSVRAPTAAQLKASGANDASLQAAMQSEQVAQIRNAAGNSDHMPSTGVLLHLAKHEASTKESVVLPEFTERLPAEDTAGAGNANRFSITGKVKSLGMEMHNHTFSDIDMPLKLMLEEKNSAARREIANTILLDPDCLARQAWDLIQMILLVWMALMLPYRVGFQLPDPPLWGFEFWWGVAVDLYFMIDICTLYPTSSESSCLQTAYSVVTGSLRSACAYA
eukprot:COSAG02_NODE_5264_length_4487_cov_1.615998_1_plen_336_part_00